MDRCEVAITPKQIPFERAVLVAILFFALIVRLSLFTGGIRGSDAFGTCQ